MMYAYCMSDQLLRTAVTTGDGSADREALKGDNTPRLDGEPSAVDDGIGEAELTSVRDELQRAEKLWRKRDQLLEVEPNFNLSAHVDPVEEARVVERFNASATELRALSQEVRTLTNETTADLVVKNAPLTDSEQRSVTEKARAMAAEGKSEEELMAWMVPEIERLMREAEERGEKRDPPPPSPSSEDAGPPTKEERVALVEAADKKLAYRVRKAAFSMQMSLQLAEQMEAKARASACASWAEAKHGIALSKEARLLPETMRREGRKKMATNLAEASEAWALGAQPADGTSTGVQGAWASALGKSLLGGWSAAFKAVSDEHQGEAASTDLARGVMNPWAPSTNTDKQEL